MKAFFLTIAAVVAVVLFGLAVLLITGVFQKETADFRGSVDQTEQVQANGSYRIAAYNSFFNQCASIQTSEANIEFSLEELEQQLPPSRQLQVQANLNAQKAARVSAINQYNADAAKTDTQANFLSSTLPYFIDANQEKTVCVVK